MHKLHHCFKKNSLSNNTSTYRIIAGVFFLMLYSFIALPVQFWHHHSYNNYQSFKKSKESSGKKIVIADGENSKADCKICSHQFSIYTVSDPKVPAGSRLIYPVWLSASTSLYLAVLLSDQSNKSPPCLA